MKRNFLRLSLQIVSLSLLCSCQQELLQTEEEYSQKSQQSTIQQLLRNQLEQKDPQLVSKVERLQVKKSSGNARIYTDSENGFSVDTEKTVYVEDAHGNKTYTFKIERSNPNSGFLENLILKQTGISEYAAYIVKYDQMAVENLGSIAQNDLKNHITFTPLGTKTGADIFEKYDAYSSCNVMMPYASNWVYVGGTMCYENAHDYAHIGNCVYKNDPAKAPTQGYATYEVSYGLVDICGSGGSSGGVGTMPTGGGGTTPVGGGGSGGILDVNIDNPCEKTKNMLKDPKVQLAIDDITKQAKKAALDINEGEIGRIEKNGNFYAADVSEDHHVIFNNIAGAKGAYHNHTYKGAKIHSPEDIFSILGFAQVQPTVANYGDAYIGMIGAEKCYPDVSGCFRMFHYIIRFGGITADLSKNFTEDEMKKFENKFIDREGELKEKLPYVNFLGDITLNKKGYEKLFFETLHNMGLSDKLILQRVDDDGTIYNINLDANGMPEATPCPL